MFVGPSVAGEEFSSYPFDFRPPVRQGDIWRATREGPEAIAIVDGYFEGVPSVWHKEILWALHQGIPVLGASSMGALRAAEMDAYGMEGVGAIYAWYRDGVIEDDDEVALVHGPTEIGSPTLSLPMVNVRATAAAARAKGFNTDNLIECAKMQFYKTRSWDTVLTAADISPDVAAWVRANPVDQKRQDALDLLDRMRDGGFAKPTLSEPFEMTSQWVRATKDWGRESRTLEPTGRERLLG